MGSVAKTMLPILIEVKLALAFHSYLLFCYFITFLKSGKIVVKIHL